MGRLFAAARPWGRPFKADGLEHRESGISVTL
jgi:hypothetical protein